LIPPLIPPLPPPAELPITPAAVAAVDPALDLLAIARVCIFACCALRRVTMGGLWKYGLECSNQLVGDRMWICVCAQVVSRR